MRRRVFPSVVVAVLVLTVGAVAATSPIQQAAANVRSAIPAIEAYRADHGTYAGMTLAKLRVYDRQVGPIVVRRASRRAYCIQSSVRGVIAHFDGPRGPARRGRCGTRGAVIPRPPAPPRSEPPADEAAAHRLLRNAVASAIGYYTDHGTYVGMTIAKLREYDPTVRGITIPWTTREQFCLETIGAGYHLMGPEEGAKQGPCPPAPA